MSLKLGLRNKIRRSRAGGFTGLLDQSFATGATAAYSLRLLRSKYSGAAVRVREDSGNTETDIGFSGGMLDETALLNHVGSNNGFVTKWYDQSGNVNDASNSTASEQPQIVSSGSVIKENGKPALQFDGNDDGLISVSLGGLSGIDFYGVQKNPTNDFIILSKKDGGANFGLVCFQGDGSTNINGFPIGDKYNNDTLFTGSTRNDCYNFYANKYSLVVFENCDFAGLPQVYNGVYKSFNGTMQERIYFNQNKSAERTKIQDNQNNFYTIF